MQYDNSTKEISYVDYTYRDKLNLAAFSYAETSIPNFAKNWTTSSFTTGDTPLCVAMSASGQYQYLSYYTAQTVYSSKDYGVTWNVFSNITARQVYCDSTGKYLVAGTLAGGSIYYSPDGGLNWGAFSGITGSLDSASFSQNAQIICIGTEAGIFISNNGGITWIQTYTEATFHSTNAMSASGQYITVGNGTATLLVSSNFGNNWEISTIPYAATCVDVSASGQYQTATTASGIYVSNNFGKTWNVGTNTSGINAGNYVVMSSSGQYQIASYSVNTLNCFISTNYGNTWTVTLVYGGPKTGFGPIAISSSGQYITAAAGNNIITSVDSTFNINPTQTTFADTGVSMTDFGKNWTRNPYTIPANANNQGGAMNVSGEIISIFTDAGNYYSNDWGNSWNGPASGSPIDGVKMAISADGKYQLIGSNSTGVYLCTNGPSNPTFSLVTSLPTVANTYCYQLAMSQTGQYMLACVGFPYLGVNYASNDYGTTWRIPTINLPPGYFNTSWMCAISASGQYQVLLAGDASTPYAFYSNDFGRSFNYSVSSVEWFTDVAMSASGEYLVATSIDSVPPYFGNSFLYSSNDYGVTWSKIPISAFPPGTASNFSRNIFMSSSGQYALVRGESPKGYYSSSNYGATWNLCTATGGNFLGNQVQNLMSGSGQSMMYCYSFEAGKTTIFQSNNSIPPNGLNYGDYLYWNSYTSSFSIGNSNVNIGSFAGQTGQSAYSIAIGASAGNYGQSGYSIALGYYAGSTSQGINAIAIGYLAGNTYQGDYTVAIGAGAGSASSGDYSVAVGAYAGAANSGTGSIAIGASAGFYALNTNQIAIGNYAGYDNTNLAYTPINSIAIGQYAAIQQQDLESISIGSTAGSNQRRQSIAIGSQAGGGQRQLSIAIGCQAGNVNQGAGTSDPTITGSAIAIGAFTGVNSQDANTIAIGASAGNNNQNSNTVSIGYLAGSQNQNRYNVAIGVRAGSTNQGPNAVAIGSGAGSDSQTANTIVIYAGATSLYRTPAGQPGFFVKPVTLGNSFAGSTGLLVYNSVQGEITYNTAKSFVVDHPTDKNKYLVHACLEGPEAGVYYRGKDEIVEGDFTTIKLPSYVSQLATNFTAVASPIFDKFNKRSRVYQVGEIKDGSFIVSGPPGKFFWVVYGERLPIKVRVNKNSVDRKGYGPYTWIE